MKDPLQPDYGGGSFDGFDAKLAESLEVEIRVWPRRVFIPRGWMLVAVLSSETFDAQGVDDTSVSFGQKEARPLLAPFSRDVDGDWDLDLLFVFRLADIGIECGSSTQVLKGETREGIPFAGSASIVRRWWWGR